jgi:RNA polymerase sigma-70 factor (ECF subfamily)
MVGDIEVEDVVHWPSTEKRGKTRKLDSVVAETDGCDIEASLAGDGRAYERLVKRYEGEIAAQMWRFTRDQRELEELVQDVFVEAYTSLGSYRARAPFLHWLRKVATRVGYRHWKRQARERHRRAELTELDFEAVVAQEDGTPSEAAEKLHELLERLSPGDRLVLTLLYFDECDTREIAERTGWSRTLVKVRAHRARKRLRALLEEVGIGRNDYA